MFRRRNILSFILLSTLSACAILAAVPIPEGTKIIMLRHADRDDVQLNEKGLARAQALVQALEGIEIDAIYVPNISRNLDTALPLASERGLEIQQVFRFDAADAFLEVVRESAGKTIVWVGNKDNIAPIWAALGLDRPSPLEYGDLFVIESAGSGMPNVARGRYGSD